MGSKIPPPAFVYPLKFRYRYYDSSRTIEEKYFAIPAQPGTDESISVVIKFACLKFQVVLMLFKLV